MSRFLGFALLLLIGSQTRGNAGNHSEHPHKDWAKEWKTHSDPEEETASLNKIFDSWMPEILREDAASANIDIEDLAKFLFSDDIRTRINASGLLRVIAGQRQDSEFVYANILSSLEAVVKEPVPKNRRGHSPRENTLYALISLKPALPDRTLTVLLDLANQGSDPDAYPIELGLMRRVQDRADVVEKIHQSLQPASGKVWKLAGLSILQGIYPPVPRLISDTGPLLVDQDKDVVKTALRAMQRFKGDSIKVNREWLIKCSESSDPENARMAQEILQSAGLE